MTREEKFKQFIINDMVKKTDIMKVEDNYDPDCRFLVISPFFDGCWDEFGNSHTKYEMESYMEATYGFKVINIWNNPMSMESMWNDYIRIVFETKKEPLQMNEGVERQHKKYLQYIEHIVNDLLKRTTTSRSDGMDYFVFPWKTVHPVRGVMNQDYVRSLYEELDPDDIMTPVVMKWVISSYGITESEYPLIMDMFFINLLDV